MKLIFLTLSFALISSCAAAPFPREKLYIADLGNKACAEYEMVSLTEVTYRHVRDLELEVGGPCDGMVGHTKRGFKKIQNWIRDAIKEGSK